MNLTQSKTLVFISSRISIEMKSCLSGKSISHMMTYALETLHTLVKVSKLVLKILEGSFHIYNFN